MIRCGKSSEFYVLEIDGIKGRCNEAGKLVYGWKCESIVYNIIADEKLSEDDVAER